MYRIDNANATSTLPTPLAPGPVTKGYFQSGNPAVGQLATTVDRDWANATQEEICAVIEAAGITLAKTNHTQLLAALRSLFGTRTTIIANLNIYVATTGSDIANTGLSAASPFLTLQKAWDYIIRSLDLNGFVVTVNVAAGTYSAGVSAEGNPVGNTQGNQGIVFLGNVTTPSNVVVTASNSNCFSATVGAAFTVQGFQLTATGSNLTGNGIYASSSSTVAYGNIVFAACSQAHVYANGQCLIAISGNCTISGNAVQHLAVSSSALYGPSTPVTVTVSGTPGFTEFVQCIRSGTILAGGITYAGAGATGTRYAASLNGVIDTAGGGATFFPGSVAGATATGGQYA